MQPNAKHCRIRYKSNHLKISKLFQHKPLHLEKMKTKKPKATTASNNKKQQKDHELIPPLGKQFQLLYRTCDKLPSSQQYQSVFFLKRKKISGDDQASSQQKKAKKKKPSSKKKKIEENQYIDSICDGLCKKNESLSMTKSTMPTSTLGAFKKSTFVDAFKENIDLERSSIKKINNLSNSNSSRYLPAKYINKQQKGQKSQKKKVTSPQLKQAKSPAKVKIPATNNVQNSNKTLQQNHNTKSTKTLKTLKQKQKKLSTVKKAEKQPPKLINKHKKQIKITTKNEEISFDDNQYVFLDGQYIQVQDIQNEALTQKIISIYRSQTENRDQDRNQFIEGFTKSKINLEKKISINQNYLNQLSQQQQQSQAQKIQTQHHILSKIIYIQRWWRSYLSQSVIEHCNNIKHFPSNAESQKQLSVHNSSQHEESDQQQEEEEQQQLDMKIAEGENNMLHFLEMREKLIFTHMQSEKDILNKMLELKKIDSSKYTNSLMEIQSNFQMQMLDIKKFKQKVVVQAERMQQLKVKLKEKSQIINKLEKLPANVILEHFIQKSTRPHTSPQSSPAPHLVTKNQPFNRQKSTGCHYSQLSQEAEDKVHTIYGKNTIKICQNNNQIKSPLNITQKQGQKQQFVHSQSDDQDNQNENENQNENNQQKQPNQSQLPSKLELQLEGAIDRQMAQAEIQKRYANQLGIGFQFSGLSRNGISTSVISIHNFLMNFLKFYEYFYKDEFLKMINLPYGLNQRSRMKLHQNYTQQSWLSQTKHNQQDQQLFFKVQSIIGDEILEDFHEHNYQLPEQIDDQMKAILFFQKIHQKAIIDCFNQSLNCFRPYYFIGGAPYIWNYSQKALTFYYIAQQNIQEVFEKTQYKVLKTASSLCGVLAQPLISAPDIKSEMNLSEKLIKYRESVDPLLIENREEKLGKVEKVQIQEYNFKWQYFQEEKTCIKFDLAQLIYEELLQQLLQIKPLGTKVQIGYTFEPSDIDKSQSRQSENQNQNKIVNQSSENSQNRIRSSQQDEGSSEVSQHDNQEYQEDDAQAQCQQQIQNDDQQSSQQEQEYEEKQDQLYQEKQQENSQENEFQQQKQRQF